MTAVLGVVVALLPTTPAGAATLTNTSWSLSSTATGATGVAAAYSFTVATSDSLSTVELSVPPGTGGTPTLSSLVVSTPSGGTATPSGASVSLGANTLTVKFSSKYIDAGYTFSIQIAGLTNAGTAGSYTSSFTTKKGGKTIDTGTSAPLALTAASLGDAFWSPSDSTTGASGLTYTYGFTTATSAGLSALTLTVPPGTGGSPSVSSVSPAALEGGTLTQSGQVLTYTFATTSIPAGTRITLGVGGLTNTSVPGSYGGQVTTQSGGSAVDSAALPTVSFTSSALTSLSWSASSTATGASGSAYTYDFTTATGISLQSVTMAVPPGTAGTPAVGTVTVQPSYVTLASPAVTLSGGLLTFTFTPTYVPGNAVFSIEITGLTNTATAGSYAAAVTTYTNATYRPPAVDSGVAPAVTFSATSLTSLSWSVSSTAVGATGVTYTLSFGLSATSTLSEITMSVPPGTAGTPVLTSASPPSVAGGANPTLAGQTLSYSFSAASVSSSATVTLVIGGMTNTTTPDVYASTVTALNGSSVVASGDTPPVTFTSTSLTSLSWSATSTTVGTSGVAYTYGFTTSSGSNLSSVTMTVPTGTAGTPAVGTASVYSPSHGGYLNLTNEAVTLNLTTLTFSFSGLYVSASSVFSIEITGLTNTTDPGTYTSSITTKNATAAVDSGTTPALSFSSSVLGSPSWTTSSTAVGGTNSTYTYGFVVQSTDTVDKVTMTVPAGTAGTVTLGTVSPTALQGGSIALGSGLLTYTLPAGVSVPANTTVSIAVKGLTNTATAGSYTSTIIVSDQGTAVASGTTPSVTFTNSVLTSLSWSLSANHTAATGVTYTYGFTTASTATLNTITMTVPSGTTGTPGVSSVTPSAFAGGTVAFQGATTLVYSFPSSTYVRSATAVSIAISGLTNTATAGSYTANVATSRSGAVVDSGTTPSVSLVGGPLASPTWSASSTTAGAGAQYTYTFATASTSPLDTVTMTVPPGTTGTPGVGTVTPAALANGASVTLAGTTLTYRFTSSTVSAGTAVSIELTGLTNTTNPGSYTSTITTKDASESIDTGVTPALTFSLPSPHTLAFANQCPASPGSCATTPSGGTQLTIVAIPGGSYASGSVQLSVMSDFLGGYRISVQSSVLTSAGGVVLPQASTSGSSTRPVGSFYAEAALAGSGVSGAALCSPYGSATPYVGFSPSAASLWNATAGTGTGSDTVILTAATQVSATQPAGSYTGTLSYTAQPATSGTSAC